jgi:NAD-dependent DNA ligase
LDVFSEFQSSEIHGFGKELQSVLHIYAKLEYIRTLRCDLEVSWVVFHPLLSQNKQGILSWKNIVITGTFDIPRSQLIRRIEEEGWKVVEWVSKKVYAVLVGQDAWSKLQQAEKLYLPMYVNFDDLVNSFSR